MSHSAIACEFAVRHQDAAVVTLQQVLITQSTGKHRLAEYDIYCRRVNKGKQLSKKPEGTHFNLPLSNILIKREVDKTTL